MRSVDYFKNEFRKLDRRLNNVERQLLKIEKRIDQILEKVIKYGINETPKRGK